MKSRELETGIAAKVRRGEGGAPTNTTGGPLPGRHGYLAAFQKDHEEDSGFMRMGVRMYDTTTMRFASVDPIEGADWNAYSYAAQDPINGMDLTGEMNIDGGGGCGSKCRSEPATPSRKKTGGGSRSSTGKRPSPLPSPMPGHYPVAQQGEVAYSFPNSTTNWWIAGGAAAGATICYPGLALAAGCAIIGAGVGALGHAVWQVGSRALNRLSRWFG